MFKEYDDCDNDDPDANLEERKIDARIKLDKETEGELVRRNPFKPGQEGFYRWIVWAKAKMLKMKVGKEPKPGDIDKRWPGGSPRGRPRGGGGRHQQTGTREVKIYPDPMIKKYRKGSEGTKARWGE